MKTLTERLTELNNDQLANIYEEAIGYNPFEDGNTREQVINILAEYSEECDINRLLK